MVVSLGHYTSLPLPAIHTTYTGLRRVLPAGRGAHRVHVPLLRAIQGPGPQALQLRKAIEFGVRYAESWSLIIIIFCAQRDRCPAGLWLERRPPERQRPLAAAHNFDKTVCLEGGRTRRKRGVEPLGSKPPPKKKKRHTSRDPFASVFPLAFLTFRCSEPRLSLLPMYNLLSPPPVPLVPPTATPSSTAIPPLRPPPVIAPHRRRIQPLIILPSSPRPPPPLLALPYPAAVPTISPRGRHQSHLPFVAAAAPTAASLLSAAATATGAAELF